MTQVFSQLALPGPPSNSPAAPEAGLEDSLGPNHPLMETFQKALKDFYTDQKKILEQCIKEMETLRVEETRRQRPLLNLLHQVQRNMQKTSESQKQLDKATRNVATELESAGTELKESSERLKYSVLQLEDESRKESELALQLERASSRAVQLRAVQAANVHQLQTLATIVTSYAAERREANLATDFSDRAIDLCEKTIDQQRKRATVFQAFRSTQAEEADLLRREVNRATLEVEVILEEKRRLLNTWDSYLDKIRTQKSREDSLTTILEARRTQCQQLSSNIARTARTDCRKAQEEAAGITARIIFVEKEVLNLRKKFQNLDGQRSALEKHWSFLVGALKEGAKARSRLNYEMFLRGRALSELNSHLRHQTDNITKPLQEEANGLKEEGGLIEGSVTYIHRCVAKIALIIERLEIQCATVENEVCRIQEDNESLTSRLDQGRIMFNTKLKPVFDAKMERLRAFLGEQNQSEAELKKKENKILKLVYKLENAPTTKEGFRRNEHGAAIKFLKKMIRIQEDRIYVLISQWFKHQLQMVQLRETIEPLHSGILALGREKASLQERFIFLDEKQRGMQEENELLRHQVRGLLAEERILSGCLQKEADFCDWMLQETESRQLEIRRVLAEKQGECSEKESGASGRRRASLELARQCTQKELELARLNKKYFKVKDIRSEVQKHSRREGIIHKLRQSLKNQKDTLATVRREQQDIVARQVAAVAKYGDIAVRLRTDTPQSSSLNQDRLRVLRSRLERMVRKFQKDLIVKRTRKEGMNESTKEARDSLDLLRMSILGLQGKLGTMKNSIQDLSRQRVKNLIRLVLRQQANRYMEMLGRGSRISRTVEQRLDMKVANQLEVSRRLEFVATVLDREFPETKLTVALILDHTRCLKSSSLMNL